MIFLILAVHAHPQYRVMSVGKVLAPGQKKSEVRLESESEGARQVELMDSGGLWPGYFVADDDEGFFEDDAGNVWTRTSADTCVDPLCESWLHVRRHGAVYWWNLDTHHTQWQPPWES